jgi:transmembrane sensor
VKIKKERMTRELLIKFINNRCTEAELDEVVRWVDSDASNDDYRKLGFEDWNSYQVNEGSWQDEKFSNLFDKIQKKIDQNASQAENRTTGAKTSSLLITWLTRAAAILLFPVLAFLFYTLSEKEMITAQYTQLVVDSLEIVAPVGSRTVVHLSDGSEVHLNYGSRLKYPQVFTGDSREVKLTGEGYFDVAHNPEKPFTVNTGGLKIKALGTSFNVNAYPEDNVETTLVNGKVVIEKSGANGITKTVGAMVPGQHVSYNTKTGEVVCSQGSVEKYIAWKTGKMVFEDTPITYVAERLSRMFNVEIEIKENAKDFLYTVTFVDEPLYQILDLMAIATPVKYKISQRKKLPDGTYSKQKIFIEKR